MSDLKMFVAMNWLSLGFHLLPIQPNIKYIMRGFGIYERQIKSPDEAKEYFGENSNNNIAVVCNGADFILDFDDWGLYANWAKSTNEVFATSYTEMTPDGAHVFLNGDVVAGLTLVDGVEIKKIGLVYPSVVDGKTYDIGYGKIYSGDVDDAFFLLSKPGTPTAHLLRTRERNPIITQQEPKPNKNQSADDLISQIKSSFDPLEVLRQYAPDSYKSLSGDGRFRACLCPFHKGKGKNGLERHRSFWVDTEKKLFGCHTCNKRGDLINLFADLQGIETRQAIKRLAAVLREVNHVAAK